ncbi:sugar ABC transporter permease, partial [Rathayibacter sp. AY2B7]
QQFFQAQNYGAASAAGVVVLIGTMAIATFALRSISTLLKEENR